MQVVLRQDQIPSSLSLIFRILTKKSLAAEQPFPELTLRIDDFQLDAKQLAEYNNFCGFAPDQVPSCYPFVACQPAQLLFLSDERVPVNAMGMIHMGVSFEQQQPLALGETYQFTLSFGEQVRNDRGLEFELLGQFSHEGQVQASFRSRCFIKLEGESSGGRGPRERRQNREWQILNSMTFDSQQARGYARLSGDYNPIHLHSILARQFGFKAPIAHGMYMVAKMLANTPAALNQASFEFKRPALLPITGNIEHSEGAARFVNDKRKSIIECQY